MTGAELRARRKALRMTQAQLGLRLGVSANTVARWEREQPPPAHPLILALALAALEHDTRPTHDDAASP